MCNKTIYKHAVPMPVRAQTINDATQTLSVVCVTVQRHGSTNKTAHGETNHRDRPGAIFSRRHLPYPLADA